MKIAHVAPLHERYDIRVFQKQCRYLAEAGYEVTLITADGRGDEVVQGISVVDVDVPPVSPRLYPRACWRAMKAAWKFDRVHFHDGFFLPFAVMLALCGKSIIYDVHEDYRNVALGWKGNGLARRGFYLFFAMFEFLGDKLFARAIAATPAIGRRFSPSKCSLVQNYPVLSEVRADEACDAAKRSQFCYVGGIALRRGAREMAEAARIASVTLGKPCLVMAGATNQTGTDEAIAPALQDGSVLCLGQVSRRDASDLMGKSLAGLLLFHADPNHVDAQPNKLFEYMAAGLPVIASDFPLWRELVEDAGCGLVVDPYDPGAIADAMLSISAASELARKMGEQGRAAVLSRLNWEHEFGELLNAYKISNWAVSP